MGSMKDLLGDEPMKEFKRPDAYARSTDPSTSHVAAASVDANRLESIVYDAIRAANNGLTWDEASATTGLDPASVSPRLKPLRKKGLITTRLDKNGDEIKRKAPGKRVGQLVWFAT